MQRKTKGLNLANLTNETKKYGKIVEWNGDNIRVFPFCLKIR